MIHFMILATVTVIFQPDRLVVFMPIIIFIEVEMKMKMVEKACVTISRWIVSSRGFANFSVGPLQFHLGAARRNHKHKSGLTSMNAFIGAMGLGEKVTQMVSSVVQELSRV